MASKSNTFDNITEGGTVDATSSAGSGDAVTRGTVTGTPTSTALTAAGFYGRGLRIIAAVGDIDFYSFTQTSATTATARLYIYLSSTRRPATASYTMARIRSSTANVCKLIQTTAGVVGIQDRSGTNGLNFNGGVAPADGWYYVTIVLTINATTGTSGTIVAKLYNATTNIQVGSSIAPATYDLGVLSPQQFHWGKPETASTANADFDSPAFNTASTVEYGPETPPSSTYVEIFHNNFEGGTNNLALQSTPTNNTGGAGNTVFDLVQSNSQVNKFSNAVVVNGVMALQMEQNVGSTSQINNYKTWSGSTNWFGLYTLVRFSKAPTGQFTLMRFFSDAAYTTAAAHVGITSGLKVISWQDGQATVTSSGTLAANTWYAMILEYKALTNSYTVKFYQRGTNTIQAQTTVTLTSGANLNSMRLGIGTTIDTGNERITLDDLFFGKNGIPDRTDIGNIPPETTSLSASKTLAAAGGSVTFTADATDADGTVADAIWSIAIVGGSNGSSDAYVDAYVDSYGIAGLGPPTMNVVNPLQMQIYCRASLTDHQYIISYTPIDDQGLAGEVTQITIDVQRATEVLCLSPGVYQPLVWYQAI